MKLLHRYNLVIACITYCTLFLILIPLYRWVFDVDGVGYSLVATHLAAGNFERAINGFWSPLHSWLVAPFINTGIPVQKIFFYSNALISLVILFLVKKYSLAVSLSNNIVTVILFSAVIFLLQFTFFELAADILVLPFILGWLLLVLRHDFFSNYKVQMLAGVLVAFAFFAKTYALPFLSFIHIVLFARHYIIHKQPVIKQLSVFLVILIAVCIPWIAAISNKYGYFTIGNSSRLNLSWFLNGNSNEASVFHIPEYADSPTWWEDPSYFKGELVNMFSSVSFFGKQVRIFFYNIPIFLKTLMDVSAFAPAIIFGMVLQALKKDEERMRKLSFFLLLFPLGYLLTFIDARYLWILNLLLLPAGIIILQKVIANHTLHRLVVKAIYLLYFLSFLLQPVNFLKDNANNPQWKEIHEIASFFRQKNLKGSFTSNRKSSESMVVAYLSDSKHYQISKPNLSYEQLSSAMYQSKISHLLFFYNHVQEKEASILNLQKTYGFSATEIKPGVLLFSRNK
jgi:hypothetical protein